MKKLLLLITALFILASVEGQILRYSNYTAPTPPEEPSGEFPDSLINSTQVMGWNIAAADSMTLDGSAITQWDDESGKNNHIVNALGDDRPTWDGTNGEVDFDGVDDFLGANPTDFNHPVTVYLVANIATRVTGKTVFQLGGPGSTRGRIYHGGSGSQTVLESGTLSLTLDATYGSYHIFTCVMNQDVTNGTIYQVDNGTAVTGTSSAGNTVTEFRIGTEYSLSNQSVKEWIIRKGADDETTRTAIINYLNAKYSIY
jgi:hypothetical protein